jgi:acetyl-CoA C-acetyltransferase
MSAPVYIVDGARSPFLKAKSAPGPFAASDLAVHAGRALLLRQPFEPSDFDEVILGCAAPSPDEVNIGRVLALRLGCGDRMPAWTVMRNCASGMQALDSAAANIQSGRSHLVLAGGTDALSRAPLLFSDAMVRWLSGWYTAKTTAQKLAAIRKFRLGYLAPVLGIVKGLTDPVVGLMMGQTAENLAFRFGISRRTMDEYSARSHQRTLAARTAGRLAEITPMIGNDGTIYADDDGVRTDSTPDKLGTLRPVFDKPYGNITAGNSSQVTDGAALLIVASEEAVARWNLKPLGRLVDSQWAALEPAEMGLGPVHASTPILRRHGLGLNDVDAWELNEAFAAQVLGCLAAWQDADYCRDRLGLEQALGTIDDDKLNTDGGAVAVGHPVGASGARIVLHLLHRLQAGQKGIATICIGGGLGGAMLVEKL